MQPTNDERFDVGIDRGSPVPFYHQLSEILRDQIVSHRWRAGDMLPSERELCETFEVSRPTVREALESLVSEGLIRREKGVGSFVSNPRLWERWGGSVVGLSDSLESRGLRLNTRVLSLAINAAEARVRQELFLGSDEDVVVLRRLRSIGEDPALITESFLPAEQYSGLLDFDFSDRSLYQTLRYDFGSEIVRVKRGIEALAANDEQAALLGMNLGEPLMYIENTAYTRENQPVEFYRAWRRGDRTRFQFEYTTATD